MAGLCLCSLLLTPSRGSVSFFQRSRPPCLTLLSIFHGTADFSFMRWASSSLFSLHPEFQIKCEVANTEVLVGYSKAFSQRGDCTPFSGNGWSSLHTVPAAPCTLTSSFPGKLSVQKPRQMVAGAAGAPGLHAQGVFRKGGESAIILLPRMEAPRVQGGQCRPSLAEGLWAQAATSLPAWTTG